MRSMLEPGDEAPDFYPEADTPGINAGTSERR
jgi:hypothetical protein